jgi:hypothetical protein
MPLKAKAICQLRMSLLDIISWGNPDRGDIQELNKLESRKAEALQRCYYLWCS